MTNTYTVKRAADRDAWLRARRKSIGASDSPAILGLTPGWATPLSVWEDKVYGKPITPETEWQYWGHAHEASICKRFCNVTGFLVGNPGLYAIHTSDQWGFMSASLDRNVFCSGDVYLDPDAALEIKNIGAYQSKKWDDLEKPPLNVQVQVQHQLAVTGWQVGFVAALIGGNEFRIYRIERDDKFIESLVITLDEFWHLVQTETMPKVDGSDVTRDALIRLGAQEDTGESMVLPPEAVEVDADLVKTLAVIKKYEGAASILKNHLREILGNNTEGTGPGFAYTYKWQDKKEHTVKASRSRVLRRRKLKGGDSNGKG